MSFPSLVSAGTSLALLLTAACSMLEPRREAALQAPSTLPAGSLFDAACRGDASRVEELLASGVPVDLKEANDWQAIHFAAARGQVEVLQLLLAAGAKTDASICGAWPKQNEEEEWQCDCQAIHLAAYYGHAEVVNLLLSKRVDVNVTGYDDATPLHYAAQQGRSEVVATLLKQGASPDAVTEYYSYTPLHWAAENNHAEVIQALAKAGAKIEALTDNADTPLHLAAGSVSAQAVRALLSLGAKVNPKAANDGIPLEYALTGPAMYGQKSAPVFHESAQLLLSAGSDLQNLNSGMIQKAVLGGSLDIVKLLIAKGARLDAKDEYGSLLVHAGTGEMADYLIRAGLDVNAVEADGATLLLRAAEEKEPDLLKAALAAGAKIEVVNASGCTALHLAAAGGDIESVRLLLAAGAKVDALANNWQPLHSAADSGHEEIVRMLLAAGAKIDADSGDGWQPIHLAADGGHDKTLKLLLQAGAKPDVEMAEGWQPIHLAAGKGSASCLKMLIEAGAKIDAATEDGCQAIHCASGAWSVEAVEFLLAAGAQSTAKTSAGWQAIHMLLSDSQEEIIARCTRAPEDEPPVFSDAELSKLGPRMEDLDSDPATKEKASVMAVRTLMSLGMNHDRYYPALVEARRLAILDLLLAAGAKVDAKQDEHWQAIHFAAANGQGKVVRYLLEKGARTDDLTSDGKSPAALAREAGFEPLAEKLLHGKPKL
jgi:ankyrin repeat protein